jgi:thioredoxin reductase (NADPH)
MQQRVLSNPKIEPVWNSTIASYTTDEAGEVAAVTLRDTVTGEERPLEVKCVFMAIGHMPTASSWVTW